MTTETLRFVEGPFDRARMTAWADAVKRAYPEYHRMDDAAANMIVGTLEQEILYGTSFRLILCFEGENLVGLLKYLEADEGRRIELHHFAVLPSSQRRGIGSALLNEIKAKAIGRASIFASGINDPAHLPLQRAGFWRAKKRMGEHAYKWSDLPGQQNDATPEADDDQDE